VGGEGSIGGGNGGDTIAGGEAGGGGGAFGGGGSGGYYNGGGGGGGGVGGGGGGGTTGGGGGFGGGQGGNAESIAGTGIGSQGSGGFGGGGGGQQDEGGNSNPAAAGSGGFGGGSGLVAQGLGTLQPYGANGGGGAGMGGAIFNHRGVLEVSQGEFTSNTAAGGGGGGISDGFGGAIFNLDGNVLLNGVTYSGDAASMSSGSSDSGPFVYNLSHNAGNVASGQTATAVLNLISTPLGASSDVLNNQVDGTATVNVNPTIAAAVLSAGPLSFGSIFVDEPVPSQTVTLSNFGNASLSISGVAISGTGFSIASNGCGTSLAEGASCQVTVAVSTASAAPLTGSLKFTDNSYDGTTQVVSLSATVSAQTAATQLAFSIPPSASVWAGGNAGAATVIETAGGMQQYTSTDNITLAVTGPNGYSQAYSTNAIAGAAVFNLAGAQLAVPGTYTYTATTGSLTGATASATVATAIVGQGAATGTITVPIAAAGTIGNISVLTQGAQNLDYTLVSGGSCSVGTNFIAGQSCTVNVAFTPVSAGQRSGAAVLYSATSAILGTGYLTAIAQGSQITYSSMSSEGLGSGWTSPYSIAVDGAANVYAADHNKVFKVAYSDASYGTPEELASSGDLSNLTAVTVDGAGNVFYSDGSAGVFELPWNGMNYGSAIGISSGIGPWGALVGLAVDGAGNLFVLDNTNDQVVEVPRTGTGYGAGVVIGQYDFINPISLAVDGADNIYVADNGYSNVSGYAAVYQFLSTGGGWSGPNTIGGGYTYYLKNVAVDATGDLYVSDEGAGNVVRFPWTGTGLGNPATILGGQWNAVAVDNLGNLYGAAFTPQVTKYTVTNPPSFNFPTATPVGQTDTADGPQTVSIFNIGNQPLEFSTPTSGGNPNYPANFPENTGDGNLCASGTPLAEGASCDVSMNFMPTTAGTNTGSVVLTDNALSQANATQSISLTGANNQQAQTIDFTPPASPVNYGVSPIALVATGGASGNPVVFSIVSGPGSVSGTNGTTLTITGVGTVVVGANQAGNANYAAASQVTQSILVIEPQTITFGPPTSPVTYPVSPIALSATGGASGNPVVFSVVSGPGTVSGTNGTTLTITDAGTVVVAANQAGNADYAAAAQVTQSILVNPPPAAILISPKPGSQLAGTGVTFTWTPAAGVTNYWLNLGTAASGVNAKNIYSSGSVTALTETVTGLPTNGETIYATLYSQISGVFQPTVYTFYAYGPAVLTAPAAGTKLTASTTFTWTPGTGITTYWLNVGTAATSSNAKNIYSSGPITTLSKTVTGIPTYGATLYVTLYSLIAGVYQPIVYTYTASGSPVAATLTTPTPSTKLTSSSAIFTWSPGEGVTYYWFNLGTANSGANAKNIYSSGSTTLTSANVTGLPTNGETVYATLYSHIAGAWQPKIYTYTASGTPTPAVLTTPTPATQLTSSTVTFTWSPGNPATNYWFNIGTASSGANTKNIYAGSPTTATSVTVTGLPTNGETIYATLYSYIDGAWQPIVYTYKAE